MNAPSPLSHRPLLGIFLCLCALFFFACMDTTTKYLVASYNVPLVVAIRYMANFSFMAVLLGPSHGRKLLRTQRTGLVIVRAVCLTAASLFVGLALQRMGVAEMTALVFLAPLLIMLIARPALGERIGAAGWTAAITGFIGVLVVARPGGELDALGIVFGLCAALANAAYQLLSRVLARTERTLPMVFHTALTGSILFGLTLPWTLAGEVPSALQVFLFLSLGVTSGLSHYFLTAAYRHAPASVLAPVNYLQLLMAGLLGWMVFGHVPDGITMAGMLIIAASGVMIAIQSGGHLLSARLRKPVA